MVGRLFMTALLMAWSLGVTAQVSVVTQEFKGGTVKETGQTEPDKKDGSVIVTLTVTPESGYMISKDDIKVMETISADAETRGDAEIKIGNPLPLEGDDPDDLTKERKYTVKVESPFGIYVKEANFKLKDVVQVEVSVFSKTSEESTEQAAMFNPPTDLGLAKGLSAYMVVGVDTEKGKVMLQKVEYLPKGLPLLLIADNPGDGFILEPKSDETPEIKDDVKASNLLRIGSEKVQPKAFEDYIFHKGRFVMVDGGKLADGKMFLDLNQEQAAKTRGVLGIGGDPNTTAIRQVTSGEQKAESWYTLDGRRLSSPPVRKGIYIKNGEKIVVK
jgi:hypothetical protein